jgi:hypothetical protein
MRYPTVEPEDTELDAMAWEFLGSVYSSEQYAGWPIDRRLDSYLRHRGLSNVADDGMISAMLLDRVLVYIASALDRGSLRPRAQAKPENHPQATGRLGGPASATSRTTAPAENDNDLGRRAD